MEAPDFMVDALGINLAEIVFRVMIALALFGAVIVARRFSVIILKRITSLTARTNTRLDDRLLNALTPPVKFLITVISIWMITAVLDTEPFIKDIVDALTNTLLAAGIFWAMYRLVDAFANTLRENERREKYVTDTLIAAGRQVARAIVLIFAFVVIMDQWGYNLGGLIAGLGIGGLAVALAAQDTLSNLVGYFAIISDAPFDVGDYISTSEAEGVVSRIGFRSTQVRQLDQSIVYVPNSILASTSITNWSRLDKRRLNTTLVLSYGPSSSTILSVVNKIREMLVHHENTIDNTVTVQFVNIDDRDYAIREYKTLKIMIIAMTDIADWGAFQKFKEDINLRILDILEQHEVEQIAPTYTELKDSGALPDEPQQKRPEDEADAVPHDAANEAGE